MALRKKRALLFIGGAGILVLALLILAYLATRFIGAEAVKEKIETELSRKTGGKVEIARAEFFLFPRPGVVFQRALISIPGRADGTVQSVTAYPEIGPLLVGNVRVAEVRVDTPEFMIILPGEEKKSEPLTLTAVERRISALLTALESSVPGLTLEVRRGKLEVRKGEQDLLSFRDMDARVLFPPGQFKVVLTCGSNLWDKMSLDGSIEPKSLRAQGLISLTGFEPHRIAGPLFPGTSLPLGESMMNLTVSFQATGVGDVKAEMRGSIPYVTVRRGKGVQVLKARSLEATFHLNEEKTEMSLDELNLEHPNLRLSGKLTLDRKTPWAALALEGREVDVPGLRQAALSLAGDTPLIQTIFDYVRGGTVPLITFSTDGKSMGNLGATENIVLKGQIQRGEIFIPGPALDLKDVHGDARISRGILKGENLEARLGNARARKGVLSVGLKGADAPFHLDIMVDADLSELPGTLKPFLKDKAFREEISLVSDLRGEARGRLVLGESLSSIKVRTDISELRLSGLYQRIPYPVEVTGGQFSFDERREKVGVKDLKGTLGTSSFSGLTAQIDIGDHPYLACPSVSSSIVLDELYPWLLRVEEARIGLKEVRSLKGRLELVNSRLKGPLYEPGKWDFEGTGEIKGLAAETSLVEGLIEVPRGRFSGTPQKISLSDVQARFLDASIDGSGTLEGYREGIKKTEVALKGEMGPEATRWVSETVSLPSELSVRSPITFSEARLSREEGKGTTFEGNLAIQDGPAVSLRLLANPQDLEIQNMIIGDEESRATLALHLRKKWTKLLFRGNLTRSTMERTFVRTAMPTEWVRGDFQAEIDLDQLANSTAKGGLEVKDLVWPREPLEGLKIAHLSLEAAGDTVRVNAADLAWKEQRLSLSGDVRTSAEGVVLNLDVSADGFDAGSLQGAAGPGSQSGTAPIATGLSGLPVRGAIRVKSGYLTYKRFTWKPFDADISLGKGQTGIAVKRAALCGISTTGNLTVSHQDIALDLALSSTNQELQRTIVCLTKEKTDATGRFDLTAQLKAEGKKESLVRSLQGSVRFKASNGQILREPVLSKIFALLSPTEIFRGRLPDFSNSGFAYRTITAEGDIQSGKLMLTRAVMDGETVGIGAHGDVDLADETLDLQVVVAPFTSVDFLVSRIPLIGGILGGHLVAVPVSVTGGFNDPKVNILSASAVGSDLLGVMKRTLLVPLKIVEPFVPGDKKE